jgi:hypothetical protein
MEFRGVKNVFERPNTWENRTFVDEMQPGGPPVWDQNSKLAQPLL